MVATYSDFRARADELGLPTGSALKLWGRTVRRAYADDPDLKALSFVSARESIAVLALAELDRLDSIGAAALLAGKTVTVSRRCGKRQVLAEIASLS